jgi:hypothetical protein
VYRLGDYMMKIKSKPQSVNKHFGKKLKVKNALESYLKEENFSADVLIQLCYDLKISLNKLNVEWKNSPYLKIGK